jgi:exopolysaccharide biosynthesis polyprenyl glycosylphosphotransferase
MYERIASWPMRSVQWTEHSMASLPIALSGPSGDLGEAMTATARGLEDVRTDHEGFGSVTGRAHSPAQSARTSYRRRALLTDVLMLAVAMGVVQLVSPTGSPTGQIPQEPFGWSVALALVLLCLFQARGMYSPPLRLDLLELLRIVATGSALAATMVMAARVLLADDAYVAAETVRHLLILLPLMAAGRTAVLWDEARARRAGHAGQRALVVGAGRIGRLAAERLLSDPDLGLRPVAFLDDDPLPNEGGLSADLPVVDSRAGIHQVLAEHDIDQVLITFSTASHEELLAMARACIAAGVPVSVVPRLFELEGERVATNHLGGLPLVAMRPTDPNGWQLRVKYAADRVLAAAALLVLTPLLAVAAAAVLMSMGRPLFYRQVRAGRDGHEFEMLKLRTLREAASANAEHDADADWLAAELGSDAPEVHDNIAARVTRVGAVLRRYSLDELPQLWNVVRGDMSLVGPRPERVTYARRLEGAVYRYEDRHRVKSGLTGWAQVNGLRGKTPLADRIEWDNHYIENWSLWFDFKILVRTVGCVLAGHREEYR